MLNNVIQRLFGGGERAVTYAEMMKPPQLIAHADRLEVRVWNSTMHSSLGISNVRFDKQDDTLLFAAKQELVSKVSDPTSFVFGFDELGIGRDELDRYALRWLDPDGTTTELSVDA